MSKLIKISLSLLLLLFLSISYAVVVPSLYSAKISVASQSAQLRNQQLPTALRSVLIKVSGHLDVTANSAIKNALRRSSQYLKEYSYVDNANDLNYPYILEASFAKQAVDALLQQAGFPIWSNNRPLTLVWLVVKDRSGLHLANDNEAMTVLDQIQIQAQQLGIPVLFPLYDLTDLQQVQPSDVWAPFTNVIQAASERYRFNELLIVRIDETNPNQMASHWTFLTNNNVVDWETGGVDLKEVVAQGMSRVMETLSSQYAVAAQGDQEAGQITMNVVGITNATVYSKVLRYLEGLTGVASVDVQDVSSSQANFVLTLTTNLKLLKRTISLNSILMQNPQADQFDEPNVLHYRYAK